MKSYACYSTLLRKKVREIYFISPASAVKDRTHRCGSSD